jgi:hypothetical protein
MARRKVPWVLVSYGVTETARFLIQQAGGVQAAHDAVTRADRDDEAGGILKSKRKRRSIRADMLLVLADCHQREQRELKKNCTDNKALTQVATRMHEEGEDPESLRHYLTRRLGKRPLAEVARTLPLYGLLSRSDKL